MPQRYDRERSAQKSWFTTCISRLMMAALFRRILMSRTRVLFKEINGFDGVLRQSFAIEAFDIGSQSDGLCKLTLPKTAPFAKGGSAPKPVMVFDGRTLVEGIDYTLSYQNNKNVSANGKADRKPQVIVKGKGDFKGTRRLDFQITTQEISKLTLNAADRVYADKGGIYQTKVEIVDIDGKKLSAGKDYDRKLTYQYAADTRVSKNVLRKAGSAVLKDDVIPAGTVIRVSAAGMGGYKGTISGEYRITKADIGKAAVKATDQIYTGSPIEPDKSDLEVKLNGKRLGNECFEIVKYDRNVNKGKASVTIKGVGNYGGLRTVNFTIRSRGFLWWWRK